MGEAPARFSEIQAMMIPPSGASPWIRHLPASIPARSFTLSSGIPSSSIRSIVAVDHFLTQS